MDRNKGKRLSGEEKLKVVVKGRQSGTTISEVCRRHQIDHAQRYRWERLARQGALEALRNGTRKSKNGKYEECLTNEINRLRAVVAEFIAENLTLKRGSWFETAPTLFGRGEKGVAEYGGESPRAE